MINKIKCLNKSKRLFLKKTFSMARCGLILSPTLFYINKIHGSSKPRLPQNIEEYTEGKIKDELTKSILKQAAIYKKQSDKKDFQKRPDVKD